MQSASSESSSQPGLDFRTSASNLSENSAWPASPTFPFPTPISDGAPPPPGDMWPPVQPSTRTLLGHVSQNPSLPDDSSLFSNHWPPSLPCSLPVSSYSSLSWSELGPIALLTANPTTAVPTPITLGLQEVCPNAFAKCHQSLSVDILAPPTHVKPLLECACPTIWCQPYLSVPVPKSTTFIFQTTTFPRTSQRIGTHYAVYFYHCSAERNI